MKGGYIQSIILVSSSSGAQGHSGILYLSGYPRNPRNTRNSRILYQNAAEVSHMTLSFAIMHCFALKLNHFHAHKRKFNGKIFGFVDLHYIVVDLTYSNELMTKVKQI